MYNWRTAEVIAWKHMNREMLLEVVDDIVDEAHKRWRMLEEQAEFKKKAESILTEAYLEERREGETVQQYIDRIMEPHVKAAQSLWKGDGHPDQSGCSDKTSRETGQTE